MKKFPNPVIFLLFTIPVLESLDRYLGFLMLVFVALIILIGLLKMRIDLGKVELVFMAMLAVFAFSSVFSESIARSMKELLRYFSYFVIFLYVRNNGFGKNGKKIYSYLLIGVTFALSLISLVYLMPFLDLERQANSMNLYYASFRHNRIAEILVFALPLILIIPVFRQKLIFKVLKLFVSLVFIAVFVLSNSVGAFIAFSLSLAIVLLFFTGRKGSDLLGSGWGKGLLGISLLLIFIIFISFVMSNFVWSQKPENNIFANLYKPAKDEQRLYYLVFSMRAFIDKPLTGWGLDSFMHVINRYRTPGIYSPYVHNSILESFSDSGVIGGGLYILLLGLVFAGIYKRSKEKDLSLMDLAILTGITASFFKSMLDYGWHYISVFAFFWIGAGFLLGRINNSTFILSRVQIKAFLGIFIALLSVQLLVIKDIDFLSWHALEIAQEKGDRARMEYLEKYYPLDSRNFELVRTLNFLYSNFKPEKAKLMEERLDLIYPERDR